MSFIQYWREQGVKYDNTDHITNKLGTSYSMRQFGEGRGEDDLYQGGFWKKEKVPFIWDKDSHIIERGPLCSACKVGDFPEVDDVCMC